MSTTPTSQNTKPEIIAGGERYISLSDAMQIYSVSRRTLYNWMESGRVQFAHGPGGARYISLTSLALRLPNGEPLQLDVPASRYLFLDVR